MLNILTIQFQKKDFTMKGVIKLQIASLIRDYLNIHPEGAFTEEIHKYCQDNGAHFRVSDYKLQLKSVSGQLSKMRGRGEVDYEEEEGQKYRWFLR